MSRDDLDKSNKVSEIDQTNISDIALTIGREREQLTLQLPANNPSKPELLDSQSSTAPTMLTGQHDVTLGNSQISTLHAGIDKIQNLATLQAEMKSRSFPIANWDRYECINFIGEGGMGRVYKARDCRLKRVVAIKFIRGDDSELTNRFVFEAQAQASIEHANICKVYETGVVEKYPFIAMQYIEGASLRELKLELNLEQKVKIIRDIALALQAAHKQGIIHRDIKPANIMVERREDGEWHPYVMDFGLARNTQEEGQTRTGAILGTPAYMSPEQATGKNRQIDRRSDVYSLGATLYELIGGQPPFVGISGLEILLKVAKEEPKLLRALLKSTPPDLDAIVMKCLEKDPARRYDSARALAEDLSRFLDGEPIEARQIGLLSILKKRAAKHRAVVVVSAISLVIVMIFTGLGIYSRIMTDKKIAAAQYFGETVKEMESYALISDLSPIHNKTAENSLLHQRVMEMTEQMRIMGEVGVGPGNLALARAYYLLGEKKQALNYIELAWQSGYQNADVAYIYADILGDLYSEEGIIASNASDKVAKDRILEAAQQRYRQAAINYLKLARATKSCPPAYLEGMVAFLADDYDQAISKAEEARVQSPFFYAALKLKALAQLRKAEVRLKKNDMLGGLAEYEKLAEISLYSIDILKSNQELYEIEALRCLNIGYLHNLLGKPADAYVEQALLANSKALQIEPHNSRHFINRAHILNLKSLLQRARGEVPEALDQALTMAQQAEKLDTDENILNIVGNLYYQKGNYARSIGENPTGFYAQAIEIFQKVLKDSPKNFYTNISIGSCYWMQALHGLGLGEDVRVQLDQAIKHFEISLEFNSEPLAQLVQTGNAYEVRGEFEASRGIDPDPWLNKAIISYNKAIELSPEIYTSYANIGITNKSRGKYEMMAGKDPRPSFQRSIEYFTKSLEILPSAETYQWLAETYLRQAQYQIKNQLDPQQSINDGQATVKKAQAINPNHFESYLRQAQFDLLSARQLSDNRGLARTFLQRANQSLQRAQQLNNSNAEIYQTEAERHLLMAEIQSANAMAEIVAGLASLDKALSINRNLTEALLIKNRLLLLQAGNERDETKRQELEAAAKAAFFTAKSINPLIKN